MPILDMRAIHLWTFGVQFTMLPWTFPFFQTLSFFISVYFPLNWVNVMHIRYIKQVHFYIFQHFTWIHFIVLLSCVYRKRICDCGRVYREELEERGQLLGSVSSCSWLDGSLSCDAAWCYLRGEKIPKISLIPFSTFTFLQLLLVLSYILFASTFIPLVYLGCGCDGMKYHNNPIVKMKVAFLQIVCSCQ